MWIIILSSAYIGFVILVTIISLKLGRTKTDNPRMTAFVGFLLSLFPPLGLIYLAVLGLKEDSGTV